MSSARGPGVLSRLWFRWKAIKLPWRKTWLVGHDLAGNTFWEFKDALNVNRFRRIMRHTRSTHYADIKISPQWHQWLRHTRPDPPTIQEQQYELSRQARMKQLAAAADERWKSVPSFLDAPRKEQPTPAMGRPDLESYTRQAEPDEREEVRHEAEDHASSAVDTPERPATNKKQDNPWQKQQRGAPSENWQPESWTPGTAQRRQ